MPTITPRSAHGWPSSPTGPPPLGRAVEEHAAALARLAVTSRTDEEADGYHPEPAPAWWKLTAESRQESIARLRAWVEQVYRPGYGHLAAALGPCWEQHDLCLYGLDIAWPNCGRCCISNPAAAPGLLSAQAEYQARILPAWPTSSYRDRHLRPPPKPRTARRPAVEHAMTDAPLRQALALAARGWPVLPASPAARPRPPGTASATPPPTPGRSPPGSAATPTGTSRSPPAPRP